MFFKSSLIIALYYHDNLHLQCYTFAGTCEDGAVRLAGTEMLGSGEGLMAEVVIKGRVELCWNEMWGSVCDQSWTVEDATVVCRELGFSEGGKEESW